MQTYQDKKLSVRFGALVRITLERHGIDGMNSPCNEINFLFDLELCTFLVLLPTVLMRLHFEAVVRSFAISGITDLSTDTIRFRGEEPLINVGLN